MLVSSGDQIMTKISKEHLASKLLQKLGHYDYINELICRFAYIIKLLSKNETIIIVKPFAIDLIIYLQGYMKRKFKEKEKATFAEALIKEGIDYPQLYYADSLYPGRLTLLRNNEFKIFIRKTARQLSPLLSINQHQFFKLLAQNLSIRTSLQSCLASFPRRAYSRYIDSRSKQKKDIDGIKDQSFRLYSFLMKIVLVIFYRISSAQHTEDKELTYSEFLLDIPKLLDIAAIYGQSNPQIVTRLIENAYSLSPHYDNDTMDFYNYVQKGKFQEMQRNQSTFIDFSPQSLSAQNFGNRQRYMIEKTMLTLFTVKDILFNLTNFITYFPKRYVYELAADYKLQQKLVDGVTFFMNQVDNQWKLGDYKERYFAMHFEDLRQSMAVYFITQFKILHEIIGNGNKDAQQFLQSAHNTYETFCQMLKFKKKRYHKQYQKLINILIEQSEDIIFFLNGTKVYNSINKTKVAVDFCQEYQKYYRRKHKLSRTIDFDPILNKNRDNLKKFKQIWIDESTRKRNIIAKQMQQKYKKIEDHQLYSYINNLKYGCKQKQYDDQPEQQEFNHVQLPNQYVKMQKKLDNLSFVINRKKHFVAKASIRQEQLNLSFNFVAKKEDLSSLSFDQLKNVASTQDSNLSMVIKQQKLLFDELDISKIEDNLDVQEFNAPSQQQGTQFRFFWDDEGETVQMRQIQQLIQSANSKKNANLQDLSFT